MSRILVVVVRDLVATLTRGFPQNDAAIVDVVALPY